MLKFVWRCRIYYVYVYDFLLNQLFNSPIIKEQGRFFSTMRNSFTMNKKSMSEKAKNFLERVFVSNKPVILWGSDACLALMKKNLCCSIALSCFPETTWVPWNPRSSWFHLFKDQKHSFTNPLKHLNRAIPEYPHESFIMSRVCKEIQQSFALISLAGSEKIELRANNWLMLN